MDRDGATVPRGTAGELLVGSYLVMQRYWADEERRPTRRRAPQGNAQLMTKEQVFGFQPAAANDHVLQPPDNVAITFSVDGRGLSLGVGAGLPGARQ